MGADEAEGRERNLVSSCCEVEGKTPQVCQPLVSSLHVSLGFSDVMASRWQETNHTEVTPPATP